MIAGKIFFNNWFINWLISLFNVDDFGSNGNHSVNFPNDFNWSVRL